MIYESASGDSGAVSAITDRHVAALSVGNAVSALFGGNVYMSVCMYVCVYVSLFVYL
jgi:hypothetical protein